MKKKLIFISLIICVLIGYSQVQISHKAFKIKYLGLHSNAYSKYDVAKDIDSLKKLIEHVHPNAYHTRSKAEIYQIFEKAKAKLPETMNRKQCYALFSSLISEYEDGHITALPLLNDIFHIGPSDFLRRGFLFPFAVCSLDSELFVTNVWSNFSKIQKGDIIRKINGYDADSLFQIMQKSHSGNARFQAYYTGQDIRFYLRLMDIKPPFRVEYFCAKDGLVKKSKEVGMQNSYIKMSELRGARNRLKYIDSCAFFSLAILNDDIAYLKFHTFIDNSGLIFMGILFSEGDILKEKLVKAFKIIQKKNIQKLIVDIRDNKGGYIKNIDYLLSYLTETDYPLVKKIGIKASYEMGKTYFGMEGTDMKHLSMKWEDHCTKEKILIPLDSFYYTNCIADTLVRNLNRYLFKGKSCFLIGSGTFSAANLTAAIVKDNKISTLIGEDTDEMVNDYGNPTLFYLPTTGMTFMIPIASMYISSRPETDKNNVKVDIEVKQDRNTLLKGEDIVLKKAIDWINKP